MGARSRYQAPSSSSCPECRSRWREAQSSHRRYVPCADHVPPPVVRRAPAVCGDCAGSGRTTIGTACFCTAGDPFRLPVPPTCGPERYVLSGPAFEAVAADDDNAPESMDVSELEDMVAIVCEDEPTSAQWNEVVRLTVDASVSFRGVTVRRVS